MQTNQIGTIHRRHFLHILGTGTAITTLAACVPITAQSKPNQVANLSDAQNASVATALEQNKRRVRAFVTQINAKALECAFSPFAAAWVNLAAPPGMPAGIKGAKAFFTMLIAAFPDLQTTIEEMIAEDDKVVVRLKVEGTNTGSIMGMPATGKRASWSVINIHRLVDGKFVEHWSNSDTLGMMQQLGLIPPPRR